MGYPTGVLLLGDRMILRKNDRIALIHIAKTQCGLADDEYRELLFSCAGIRSAAELSAESQFDSIMAAFKKLGFRIQHKAGGTARQRLTSRQRRYIGTLWQQTARNPEPEALDAFCRRITHAPGLSQLNRKEAANVIEALLQMSRSKESQGA